MKDLRLAVVCMQSDFGRIEKNIAKMESFVQKAAAQGASMICFPELSATGYTIKEDPQLHAESVPGPISDRIVKIAEENKLVIMAGMLEKGSADKPHISQIVAGPYGIIGMYQKTHLSPKEKEIYEPGQIIKTFTYDHINFGIQLCYETHFPELSTMMALQGAEIVFFLYASPYRTPQEKRDSWLRDLPARAFDNGIFIVACNQVGENGAGLLFPGVIIVLGPAGKIRYQYTGNKEKMIIAGLKGSDLAKVRTDTMRYFIKYRRPELYRAISQQHSH
ncbi:MAG: nitrilase-related carbon-nitrogen hydrolase [Candidatus Omnitrophota bacterium]